MLLKESAKWQRRKNDFSWADCEVDHAQAKKRDNVGERDNTEWGTKETWEYFVIVVKGM